MGYIRTKKTTKQIAIEKAREDRQLEALRAHQHKINMMNEGKLSLEETEEFLKQQEAMRKEETRRIQRLTAEREQAKRLRQEQRERTEQRNWRRRQERYREEKRVESCEDLEEHKNRGNIKSYKSCMELTWGRTNQTNDKAIEVSECAAK